MAEKKKRLKKWGCRFGPVRGGLQCHALAKLGVFLLVSLGCNSPDFFHVLGNFLTYTGMDGFAGRSQRDTSIPRALFLGLI